MSNEQVSLPRLGFDLRGLMALTCVAAFVAMTSKIDMGAALVFAAIFFASAMMAHLYPVGSAQRPRAMLAVLVIGAVIAALALIVQFLVLGRLSLAWGTTLGTCIGVGIGSMAVCKSSWRRWSKRVLAVLLLMTTCYLAVDGLMHRNIIYLSLRHQVYYLPRFNFMLEGGYLWENWWLNRFRNSIGLTRLYGVYFEGNLMVADWKSLFDSGPIETLRVSRCDVDLTSERLTSTQLKFVNFHVTKFEGNSLGIFAIAANPSLFSSTSVRSRVMRGFLHLNRSSGCTCARHPSPMR